MQGVFTHSAPVNLHLSSGFSFEPNGRLLLLRNRERTNERPENGHSATISLVSDLASDYRCRDFVRMSIGDALTNIIPVTASQMASAAAISFLFVFTYGFTNRGH